LGLFVAWLRLIVCLLRRLIRGFCGLVSWLFSRGFVDRGRCLVDWLLCGRGTVDNILEDRGLLVDVDGRVSSVDDVGRLLVGRGRLAVGGLLNRLGLVTRLGLVYWLRGSICGLRRGICRLGWIVSRLGRLRLIRRLSWLGLISRFSWLGLISRLSRLRLIRRLSRLISGFGRLIRGFRFNINGFWLIYLDWSGCWGSRQVEGLLFLGLVAAGSRSTVSLLRGLLLQGSSIGSRGSRGGVAVLDRGRG